MTDFYFGLCPRASPRQPERIEAPVPETTEEHSLSILGAGESSLATADIEASDQAPKRRAFLEHHGFSWRVASVAVAAFMLTWIAYNTTAEMIGIPMGRIPGPVKPLIALEPFWIANQYGLFAVMTRGRYEIECQGSDDGTNWIAYPFRNKPQALNEAPESIALSAALRLEPVVCVARWLARERDRAADRGAPTGRRRRCAGAFSREPFRADSAAVCPCRDLAVLVYN